MTALCGGGTSGAKAGVAAVVDYSSGLIASILASRGLGWLIPVIPLAGLPPLILSTFCASDPPAVPTFTSAETNAVLQLQFGADFDSGISKLKDLILYSLWYDACQCTSGSLTAFPTVTPPTGTPIFQPPVTPAVAPCDTTGLHTVTSFVGPSPGLLTTKPIQYVDVQVTNTILTAGGFNVAFDVINFSDISGRSPTLQNLGDTIINVGAGTSERRILTTPAGTNFVRPDVTKTGGAGTGTITYTIDGYCTSAPPGASAQPCCPPDPATQSYLDLILQTVTLIQRQAVPFAYIASTAHAGLSGAGTLNIAGLIGVKVAVTTVPTALGRAGTTPTEYFNMGYLTFGTPDGYPHSVRLERDAQVVLPPRCSAFTVLAYDLTPGVVVTITELIREP